MRAVACVSSAFLAMRRCPRGVVLERFWAARLVDANRANGATAGLRRGELMALRADAIDLAGDEIHVLYGWDVKEGSRKRKAVSAGRSR